MNPKVRVAICFIGDNLQNDIYLAELAKLVSLSPSRFSHLFTSELRMPFTRYLKKARLEKAGKLLEESFTPVKLIALRVGYNDPAHFEREFKKVYGVTPSQYRADNPARMAV